MSSNLTNLFQFAITIERNLQFIRAGRQRDEISAIGIGTTANTIRSRAKFCQFYVDAGQRIVRIDIVNSSPNTRPGLKTNSEFVLRRILVCNRSFTLIINCNIET